MGLGNKIKYLVGIEGNTREYLRPMVGYDCANVTLGGAGYPISLYHQQFLNFVEGIRPSITGTISMISGLIDAVTDVAMGVITDRTKSRYGKHRRYLIWGLLPFVISYVMKWCSFGLSSTGNTGALFAYYLFASLLYSTGYTMMSIPHQAMLPTVAPRYFERTQFKIIEYAFNSLGQFPSFVFMSLILGGTNMNDPSPADRNKYMLCGIVLAVWFLWSPIVCFFSTKEKSSLDLENPPMDYKYLFSEYAQVFRSRAFRQYFLINLLNYTARSCYSYSDQYFLLSIADRYRIFNILNVVSGAAEFSGSPINYFLIRFKDKRICGLALGPMMVAGLLINGFVTTKTPTFILYAAAILYNLGFSGPGFSITNFQPDVTDVDELITGRRREGVITTFTSFVKKTVQSFMTGLLSYALELFGYNTNAVKKTDQTARAILGLRFISSWLPAALAAISVVLIFLYKMDKHDHETIQRVIKEKHETGSCTITEHDKKRLERIAGHAWEDMWIGRGTVNRKLEELSGI